MIEDPASWISLVCTLMSAAAGFLSVRYWYLSSIVETLPLWALTPNAVEPLDASLSNTHWINGALESSNKTSRLNKMLRCGPEFLLRWALCPHYPGFLLNINPTRLSHDSRYCWRN